MPGEIFPTPVAPPHGSRGSPEGVDPIPSIHHFPGSKTMDWWPRAMGWMSRPEATFINLASAKTTIVNVKLSGPIYKCNSLYRREEIYFLGCSYWQVCLYRMWLFNHLLIGSRSAPVVSLRLRFRGRLAPFRSPSVKMLTQRCYRSTGSKICTQAREKR